MADTSFENMDVTPDELQRLEKALKDEKFRQMLVEYAQELKDPENRRKYEEEIAMLEQNRGMDVTFINPSPGYVLKTNNGEKKIFINMCKSDKVAEPKAEATHQEANGVKKPGISWSIPYSLSPGREDLDKAGKTCTVYDVVFHPMCFEHYKKDPRLKDLMEGSALDGIEREFKEKLDRTNLRRPKMKFKGQPQSSIIRRPNAKGPSGKSDAVSDLNLPYPFDDDVKQKHKDDEAANAPAQSSTKISGDRNQTNPVEKQTGPAEPKYTITHRGHVDMQQFTNARDSMPTTRPQELVVRVELPLLKSAAPVQLDVFEKRIVLESKQPVAYKLNLQLPFPVDEEKGSAKFDKSKSCLVITLPVLPPKIPDMLTFAPEAEKPAMIEEIKQNHDVDESTRDGDKGSDEAPIVNEPEKVPLIEIKQNGDVVERSTTMQQVNHKNEDVTNADVKLDEEATAIKDDKEVESDGKESPVIEDNADSSEVQENALDSDDDELPKEKSLTDNSLENQMTASDTDTQTQDDASIEPPSKPVTVLCPYYTFKQDPQTVTFVVHAQNIDPESVEKEIHTNSICSAKFQFRTKTPAGDDVAEVDCTQYSLYIKFEDGCVVGDDVKVELTDKGAVLVMVKDSKCQVNWSGFKVGVSSDELKGKKFLTESNILNAVSECAQVNDGSADLQMEVTMAQSTDQHLVVEFEPAKDAVSKEEDGVSECILESATDVVMESLIGEASDFVIKSSDSSPEILKLDLNRNFASDCTTSTATCSDTSPPSTPSSATSLKSAIRSHRIQHSKSVSFSEDVEVEVLVSPGKTKKGKRRPFVAKRRIERLKDTSQGRRRYHSDSEVPYKPSGGSEFWVEDFEEDFKKILPDGKRTRSRHSSSESESGQDEHGLAKSEKGSKKSRGSKKQRRKQQKAKRALGFDGQDNKEDDQESGDNPESPSSDGASSPTKDFTNKAAGVEKTTEEINCEENDADEAAKVSKAQVIEKGDEMDSKASSKSSSEESNVRTENLKTKEEVPLEYQDHTTKNEVAFENKLMFELDD